MLNIFLNILILCGIIFFSFILIGLIILGVSIIVFFIKAIKEELKKE